VKETNHSKNRKAIYWDTNLQIIFSVTLMAVLWVSSITPAFPKIAQALSISPRSIEWLIMVFTFPGIFLAPILGVLADRLGRKKTLVPALMLFGIAGGACAFTRDFDLLLILRFF
jgi:MFS family permease